MIELTTEQLGVVLHKSRNEPRRNAKRYLKDNGGEGTADELDAIIEKAEASPEALAEADRLNKIRKHTLRGVEQGMIGQIAEMIAAVRLEMEAQDLTQSELAERCNLTQPMLSAYLNGKREPSLGNFAKLATALGCVWRLQPKDDH